jgi:hypothetical protein
MLKAEGIAKLTSEATEEVFEILPAALDWQDAGAYERGMGTEYLQSADVEFTDRDGQPVYCEWTASEYPIGALNNVTHHTRNAKLVSDFSFSWEHQPDTD